MSQEDCWECEESYAKDEVLDIPIFHKGYTVKWCLNCMMKQLVWTDYKLIPTPKNYKEFKIKSIEDDGKEWHKIVDELISCFESQIRKLKEIDYSWGEIHGLASEIQYAEDEPEEVQEG